MRVITYQHAYIGGTTTLCHPHAAHPPDWVPSLGPVSYGEHEGTCRACERERDTKTAAEQVAAQLGDDGQCWETSSGRTLEQLALAAGASKERRYEQTRYRFRDGSSIVDAVGGWDLGIAGADDGCWCWKGAGHSESCVERRSERTEVQP